RDELLAWRKAWDSYRRDIGKLEGVASLYRSLNSQKETDHDSAMEATAGQALASLPGAVSAALPLKDLALEERNDRLVFSNSRVRLELGKSRGEWLSFQAQGIPGSLTAPAESPAAVDFRIDDVWMVERHGAAYLRHTVSVDAPREAATVCLALGVGPPSRPPLIPDRWRERTAAGAGRPAPEFELTSCYTLYSGQSRVDRTARVTRLGGADILASTYVRMQGFLFELPGALIADAEECTVENPGPLYLNSYLPPDTPYAKVRDRFLSLSSAPDSTPGVLAIVNRKRNATLASWLDTGGETNYISYLSGDGRRLTVLHCDLRIDRMHRRAVVASDTHRIELVEGGLPEALARYRESLRRGMPLAANTPRWTRDMTLLEVLPSYFPDGIRGLTKKLPFYKEVGFNTIYLMPHWVGGYSPVDLYQVEPSIGTAEDLKEMVRAAHALGLRVLFDMVIHGFNTRSPIIGQRPELFQKDEHGLIVPHQTWGSMSTDAASPAYRQYMTDLALHDLRTYDIDGYRVDANAYKMPNWDPRAAASPGVSGPATRSLMVSMYQEMRKVKPDSVLLSEIFGPVWHSVCNLVHDNMTQGSIAFLEMMDRGEVDAESYKRHLARLVEALPEGALRVRFGRNHDTSWFYHFPGYTPRFMAFDAIHAFFGVVEVFAGDRKNPPHPDDDPAVYDYYRKLLAARRQFPELAAGDVLLREVECDNRKVFTGLRRLGETLTLVAISLDGSEVEAGVTLPRECPPRVELHDPIAGGATTVTAGGRRLRLKLKPYQILIGRLEKPFRDGS
ncbi:MAG: hypothetical protein HY822_22615, partial [Acidobacteria bacterium]|nr:hypothetical protein [Acidobacteriota bacterium]